MTYTLQYDARTGAPVSILRSDGAVVPIAPGNADFQAFLAWNAQQPPPLDYTTPISPTARKPLPLLTIYNAILALTSTQKTNIWNDLTSGSPVKISQDVGPNAASIFLLWRIASNISLPAATITDMKITAATYYVQDNPTYLVNPSFDNTINVPGDQPA